MNEKRSLVFDPVRYVERIEELPDAWGKIRAITYRFYGPICYVSSPVVEEYQSLVVSVPTAIDGIAIDASQAPILLVNAVGAYMPTSVAHAKGVGCNRLVLPGAEFGPRPVAHAGLVNGRVNLAQVALAAGFVVVEPGVRGRSLQAKDGEYVGVAPAAIVDLKAAVRYITSNAAHFPGDTARIISTGTSAGGALSALLGVSGDSPLYQVYLQQIGAAQASDRIFASAVWCPIADLEHADAAYEWNWGSLPVKAGVKEKDPSISTRLAQQFKEHQSVWSFEGLGGFGPISAENYREYLLSVHLEPAATEYLNSLTAPDRSAYLEAHPSVSWDGQRASFTWDAFLQHVGARKKSAPAFDALDLSTGENNEFGRGKTKARHFTRFAAQHSEAGPVELDEDIAYLLRLMNPMGFIAEGHESRARHWWIRLGASDTDTSLSVSANLAAGLHTLGDDVDYAFYWDQGHATNCDPDDFLRWVEKITGWQSLSVLHASA